MRSRSTRPLNALIGVLLLCVHLLSCSNLAALILALTAVAGGDHRVLIVNSGDAVQLRLSHSLGASKAHPAHCHCLLSRVVVAFADESRGAPDHIVTFQAPGWSDKVEGGSSLCLDPKGTRLPLQILIAQFLEVKIQEDSPSIAYTSPSIPCCGIEVYLSAVMLI